jgi:hypothetical protein
MPLYFKLDDRIDGGKLLEKIQRLINQTKITKDSIMVIDIKTISREDNSLIPKLEYKKTPKE